MILKFMLKLIVSCVLFYIGNTALNDSNKLPYDPLFEDFNDCYEPPNECPNKDISFWLYKRVNQKCGAKLSIYNCTQLNQELKSCEGEITILIHGNQGNKDDDFNQKLRQAIFGGNRTLPPPEETGKCVISVDWSPLTPINCFTSSARNTPVVGNCTADLIDKLVLCANISMKRIRIIGFSFGAQVIAFIPKNLKNGGILYYVIALDPSRFPGKMFDTSDNTQQLDPTDAKWIQCHHTAAGYRSQIKPRGHCDIYWNNGQDQPGCEILDQNPIYDHVCSHLRSYKYYAETNTEDFYARRCEFNGNLPLTNCGKQTYIRVGFPMPYGTTGIFQVTTSKELIDRLDDAI